MTSDLFDRCADIFEHLATTEGIDRALNSYWTRVILKEGKKSIARIHQRMRETPVHGRHVCWYDLLNLLDLLTE